MVIKTASPGVVVNEVDLTRGTSDAITTNVGGFVGPFARGPVGELVLVETEAELQRTFGDPTTENAEYWYTVSNFLEYGGVCFRVSMHILPASFRRAPHAEHGTWALEANQANS